MELPNELFEQTVFPLFGNMARSRDIHDFYEAVRDIHNIALVNTSYKAIAKNSLLWRRYLGFMAHNPHGPFSQIVQDVVKKTRGEHSQLLDDFIAVSPNIVLSEASRFGYTQLVRDLLANPKVNVHAYRGKA